MAIKVVMFIEYFHPVIGGAERQLQSLCKHLSLQGVDVTVVTTRWRGLKSFEIIEGIPVYRRFGLYSKLRIPSGRYIRGAFKIPQYRYELTSKDFYPSSPAGKGRRSRNRSRDLPYGIYRCYLLIIELIKYLYLNVSVLSFLHRFRKNFDIVHVHVVATPYGAIAAKFGKIFNKKVIAKAGDVKDFVVLSKFKFYKHYLNLLKRSIDILVCINDEIVRKAIDLNFDRKKLLKIPNGVDVDKFNIDSLASKDQKGNLSFGDKRIVTCVGSQGIKRGLDILIEAWRQICFIRKDMILLIIGRDGDHSQVLRKLVNRYRIGESVLFLGEQKDIRIYLRITDVFVLPSRTEGFSNALLEAMACRLPVVATRVGGAKEIIKNGVNGLLVEPESSTQIKEAILRLIDDKILCNNLSGEARKTVREQYSFSQITQSYIHLYQNVLSIKKDVNSM